MVQSIIGVFNVIVNEARRPSFISCQQNYFYRFAEIQVHSTIFRRERLCAVPGLQWNGTSRVPYKKRTTDRVIISPLPAKQGMPVNRVMMSAQAWIPQGGL
jgi:hypothetical protein